MSIFEFRDYKAFISSWLSLQPKRGHGLVRKMAEHLRISPPMMSHILKGEKHLSPEAANDLIEFIGLNDDEFDYFLLMLMHARAGSFSLKKKLERKIIAEQKKANEIKKKMKADAELPDVSKAIFYSSWIYAGVRNMTACPTFKSVNAIAEQLHLPRAVVQKTVDFLLQAGLCTLKNGELDVGPQQTHVDHRSSFVNEHHQNWRIQAITKMTEMNDKNLFFTGPMSLSQEVAEKLHQKIPTFIEEVRKAVRPSDSEVVRCLNIDWFEY